MKSEVLSLKKIYTAGSQMWFSKEGHLDTKLRGYGCGVVALHDLGVYRGFAKASGTRGEYKEHIRRLEKGGLFVFPNLGIAPYYYPLLCDLYLARHHIGVRIGWGHTAAKEYRCKAAHIKRCLKKDMPVIFAVGPTWPFLFKNKRIALYSMDRKPTGRGTKAHYMTVLGLLDADGDIWLEVASWGEQFSIKLSDLAEYSKYAVPFTTRFYNVYEKKGRRSQ
ncbi:MAG: hypothetical protein K5871_12195 [Lachnospiraceae bacterium]|nr:hypothetical protein [Lachnospiraceae bacterium]